MLNRGYTVRFNRLLRGSQFPVRSCDPNQNYTSGHSPACRATGTKRAGRIRKAAPERGFTAAVRYCSNRTLPELVVNIEWDCRCQFERKSKPILALQF